MVHARWFGAEVVNHADAFVVCGRPPGAAIPVVVLRTMEWPRLPLNAMRIGGVRVPKERLEFFGYRDGRNYNPRPSAPLVSSTTAPP